MSNETNPTQDPPANIDDTIQALLNKAFKVANDLASDPKEVCALGWLVLKIKEHQMQAAAAQPAKPRGLSPETIRQIEEAAKML
jgi:hypothetical protein